MIIRRTLSAAALVLLAGPVFGAPGTDEPESAPFRSKPTAPIGIVYELSQTPIRSQPLEIVLTITAEVPLAGGVLTLGVDDPLVLIEPPAETVLGTLEAGVPVTVTVTVLPLLDETQYLRVAVAGAVGGEPQLRTLSIPIRFESAAPDKDNAALPMSPADAVQSLEAVETVYR